MATQLYLAFGFGVVFLLIVVMVALRDKPLSQQQMDLVRPIQAIALAGIAAIIPGFLEIDSKGVNYSLRAGGALAVFVLVYLVNPAGRLSKAKGGK